MASLADQDIQEKHPRHPQEGKLLPSNVCKSLPVQELLGHADFSLVGDLAEEDGGALGHEHGPSRIKMFRDTHQLTGSPYYVRAY